MKEIRIPLEQFDLEGFLDRTVEFLREWWSTEVDPTYGIISVQGLGEISSLVPKPGGMCCRHLKRKGKGLLSIRIHRWFKPGVRR